MASSSVSWVMAPAHASTSSGCSSMPASPTTSGSAPVLAARTAVPAAMASRGVSPKPSYFDGCTRARAAVRSTGRSDAETKPVTRTASRSPRRAASASNSSAPAPLGPAMTSGTSGPRARKAARARMAVERFLRPETLPTKRKKRPARTRWRAQTAATSTSLMGRRNTGSTPSGITVMRDRSTSASSARSAATASDGTMMWAASATAWRSARRNSQRCRAGYQLGKRRGSRSCTVTTRGADVGTGTAGVRTWTRSAAPASFSIGGRRRSAHCMCRTRRVRPMRTTGGPTATSGSSIEATAYSSSGLVSSVARARINSTP